LGRNTVNVFQNRFEAASPKPYAIFSLMDNFWPDPLMAVPS
jgi:hypothetical protein